MLAVLKTRTKRSEQVAQLSHVDVPVAVLVEMRQSLDELGLLVFFLRLVYLLEDRHELLEGDARVYKQN